jgi:hypothetical protein
MTSKIKPIYLMIGIIQIVSFFLILLTSIFQIINSIILLILGTAINIINTSVDLTGHPIIMIILNITLFAISIIAIIMLVLFYYGYKITLEKEIIIIDNIFSSIEIYWNEIIDLKSERNKLGIVYDYILLKELKEIKYKGVYGKILRKYSTNKLNVSIFNDQIITEIKKRISGE